MTPDWCADAGACTDADAAGIFVQVMELEKALADAGVRVTSDCRTNYTPGWKYNHWEVKGVPIRVELGPRRVPSCKHELYREPVLSCERVPCYE